MTGVRATADPIVAFRQTHETEILATLDGLVRLPSVAADPRGLEATAQSLAAALQGRGFRTQLLRAADGGPPVVFGDYPTPGAKHTVVFYAHYDGQPVTPSQWTSDPFVPVLRAGERVVDWRSVRGELDPEWRFYGRAVSDDKASIVAFLAAFDALAGAHRHPAVNLKVVWEGEEESGSTHLPSNLAAHAATLSADLWLIGDGPVNPSRRPQLYFGARGVMGLELTVYGPLRALHDGHYGNWAPNPAALAANLLASMRDDTGRILVPGIADAVRPLDAAERVALADLPAVDTDLERQFGIARPESAEPLAASIMRPALNVRGLRAGQIGASAANAIPTEAIVSLDFRLVPDQQPAQVRAAVESFLRERGWTLVTEPPPAALRQSAARLLRLDWEAGYPALRTDMTSPAARAVIATVRRATRAPLAVVPMVGGSVPLYAFADLFHVPVIGLPIVNHDNNQHAADENLRLGNLWDGIDTYAALMGRLDW